MTSKPTRLLAAALALLFALSAPLTALASELPAPVGEGETAQPLEITVPDYTPGPDAGDVTRIQKGGLYTLIVLPSSSAANGSTPKSLTAELLLASDPLFIGSAVASDNGKVTFTNIRLRTAAAAVYYVTGPGLDTPLMETTGLSVALYGTVTRKLGNTSFPVDNATVSLVDKITGYVYANSDQTGSSGSYALEDLSPGEYYLHVDKPGYIPATDTRALTLTDDTTLFQDFDISAFLGDVNGDGKRDLADLTALLSCYGKPFSDIPAGLVPNLYDADQAINLLDVALLLNTMNTFDSFPSGVGAPTAATVSVKDTADASQTNRALTFSLNNGGTSGLTFTAANVTLTFRTDYIQPINQNGGAVNPANPITAINCLVPKSGVTISDARWSVSGDLATLTFSFSCAKPTALTDLVELRYRPAPGKTAGDFFEGVFTVDHAAAQVGEVTVLTKDEFNLEYPQSSAPELDSITIDQTSSQLTIPTEWRTAVMALSATGHMGETAYPSLSGVTWALADSYKGVSIANSLLTVTHEAQAGDIQLTASLGGVTSAPLTVTLENAPAVPSRISIANSEGAALTSGVLEGPAGSTLTAAYQAQVFDQYSTAMEGETVTWSLSGAPAGVAVSSDGALTAAASLPAGTYTFSLHAGLDGYNLRATAAITLTLEPELKSLVLSGPTSAQIPSGADPLTLRYILSALDAQGNPMSVGSLSPSFTVTQEGADPDQSSGVTATVDMTGNFTVTVDSTAQPGEYALLVTEGDVTASLTLTLQAAQEDSATLPVRAALSYDGQISDTLEFTQVRSYITGSLEITPVLLNRDDQQVNPTDQRWLTQIPDLPDGLIYNVGADGHLALLVEDSLLCGTYLFTITAHDSVSGLRVSTPVKLTLVPRLGTLTLSAPATLSIPSGGDLRYTIAYTALDGDEQAMSVTDRLTWRVTDGDGKPPAGVSMRENELIVSPSAKPGEITVSVRYDEDGDGTAERSVASCKITLERTGTEKVLALQRNGDLLTGGVDTAYGKEGTAVSMTYVPVLLDPTTGNVTEVPAGQFTWMGAQGSFTVEAAAEPGVYTAPITVICEGQSVSLTAQVTVYPDITSLYIQFDEGDTDTKDEQYLFPIPLQAAKTYYGDLMAKVTRGGKTVSVPLTQLGLTDYEIEIYSPLTGVYTVYDKATGRFTLTIDPAAESNSMRNPDSTKGETEIRYLRFLFSYYPGQDEYDQKQLFMLSRESSTVTTAILRQGTGVGSKFVFETSRGEIDLNAVPGVLSNCYALELLDQYGNAVTNQPVTWTLTGSPKDGSTNLISPIDPGEAVTNKHPLYQSIRRLRIAPETPEGTYELTLTASAAGFSRSVDIHLTVSGQQEVDTLTITGADSSLIPKYYTTYNKPTVNNEPLTTTYTVAARDKYGNELDASMCDFEWSVTTASGGTPTGVSISPDKKNPTIATLTIDRHANPTGSNEADRLKVIVTATPKGSGVPFESEARLALTRGSLVPTLMTINGPSSYKMELDGPDAKLEYTFDLVNQYNDPVPDRDATTVNWRVSGKLPSFVTVDTSSRSTDSRGYPSAKVAIKNPGVDTRASITLIASITFAETGTSSGNAMVYASRTVTITVGNPPGGGLGGDIPEEVAPITTSSVTPSTSKSGTTGTSTLSAEDVDVLTKTTATGTLTIAPKNTSGLTSITVNFPASVAKAIAAKSNSSSLRVQTALGTLILSRDALSSLNRGSGNISITILNQDNKLAVTFRSAGTEVKDISKGTVSFQAPVKGDMVTAVSGSNNTDILHKAVITNGSLSVTLSGSVELTLGAKGKVFSDTQNHWAKSAVEFVTARDLFQGTSETTFSPNANMTRSMVVTVLHRLENTPATSAANPFSDVPSNTWYTTAVVWANDNGIVKGTGDGFLPNDPVTREQLATILYRYMTTQNYNTTQRSSLSSFSDSAKVSSWAKEAMEWAVSTGLITGKTGGLLDPGGNASRAEVATIFERLVHIMAPSV